MRELNWATLGCGVIANQLEQALEGEGRKLYSVANRTHAKGVAFAEKYGIGKVYDNIDDVFADPDVDVIYISTPHNTHIEFLRKALTAGKHVLCEKSITLNSEELNEAVALAAANAVVLGEAMTLYHMPLYRKLNEIIASGKLGDLKLIQMNFGSYKEYDMTNRFFNRELAGGAMLDIGVYALSFVRWFMSSTPDQILSQVKRAPSGVDEQAGILLTNPDGQMATVTLSLHAKQPKRGLLSFDKGFVEIYDYPRGERATITYVEDGHTEVVETGETAKALAYEVADMEAAIAGDRSVMHLDYTRDVMDMMTLIRRAQWGMTYPEEEASSKRD
ncbi:Gfo/Idh/MocA family protein [Bifidobacterium callitrichidarum]|uniref:Oxidoreductase n=1 Tax=Bifidobacterium callitrichidarum TaxID=2052941 RepID=A0A2U2N5T7_9BIFI|nr:Gfo/Idh/MocA family oxidoreductase [Bifidobacterium callitrichidarum]PWG64437.1 oxidoreductase [Bifidobacterium callitrichidarum]